MAQKQPERPDGDQHELVRSHKSSERPTEVEGNSRRHMPPMGQRGLNDDGDDNNETL